jgi:hypothetical protein
MFAKRLPLAPLREGELDVWVTVCVRLSSPVDDVGDPSEPPAVGYFRNLGIRLPGAQPKSYLEKMIADGSIDWNETEFYEVDPTTLDRDIRKRIVAPDENGVWYSSGRIYFPEAERAG